jgi:hypothetical protein
LLVPEWEHRREVFEVCKYGMNANGIADKFITRNHIYRGTDFAEKARAEALKMQQEMELILSKVSKRMFKFLMIKISF